LQSEFDRFVVQQKELGVGIHSSRNLTSK
jgi:hypothetical protein